MAKFNLSLWVLKIFLRRPNAIVGHSEHTVEVVFQMSVRWHRIQLFLSLSFSPYRYSLMTSCWAKDPENRPSFSDIVTIISNYTEAIAGYLDINFNPFESSNITVSNAAAAVPITSDPDSPESEDVKLGSTELLAHSCKGKAGKKSKSPKVSPNVSPNALRKPSPRISPRASPLFKLRKLMNSESSAASRAAVEIRVESPL